jgi:hypothetical protein
MKQLNVYLLRICNNQSAILIVWGVECMQVPSIPIPVIANALPQDIAAKAVPNTQAMAPLVQNAIDPTHKDEKFNEVRRKKDDSKDKRGDKRGQREEDDKEGDHSVNIRI